MFVIRILITPLVSSNSFSYITCVYILFDFINKQDRCSVNFWIFSRADNITNSPWHFVQNGSWWTSWENGKYKYSRCAAFWTRPKSDSVCVLGVSRWPDSWGQALVDYRIWGASFQNWQAKNKSNLASRHTFIDLNLVLYVTLSASMLKFQLLFNCMSPKVGDRSNYQIDSSRGRTFISVTCIPFLLKWISTALSIPEWFA